MIGLNFEGIYKNKFINLIIPLFVFFFFLIYDL